MFIRICATMMTISGIYNAVHVPSSKSEHLQIGIVLVAGGAWMLEHIT
jgi:hypothetical protein